VPDHEEIAAHRRTVPPGGALVPRPGDRGTSGGRREDRQSLPSALAALAALTESPPAAGCTGEALSS
jgi:hypothetical protein